MVAECALVNDLKAEAERATRTGEPDRDSSASCPILKGF